MKQNSTFGKGQVRFEFKHIHRVKKRLADGSSKYYHYHRLTGKRIHGQPGTPEFIASYEQASRIEHKVKHTFAGLVVLYRASPEYQNLSASTREAYAKALESAVNAFGTAPFGALEDKRFRREVIEFRDTFKGSPSVADKSVAAVSAVLTWAMKQTHISHNRALGIDKLYKGGQRAHIIWSEDQIDQFITSNPPHMWRPLIFAKYTMQRQEDVLRLNRGQLRDGAFHLQQGKTKKVVEVPVHPALLELIKETPEDQFLFLTNSRGQQWTTDGFKSSWRKAMKRAGLEHSGLHFHDLRGTGVSSMIAAGVPTAIAVEIAGMTIETAENYMTVSSESRHEGMNRWARAEDEKR
ncbi:MAG: tyrosine-type recombinase/integrase [Alphaproteobacteria bacterium]